MRALPRRSRLSLINQAYFVSFLWGWGEAKATACAPDATASSQVLARLLAVRARSVRVRFVYLPDADALRWKRIIWGNCKRVWLNSVRVTWGYKGVVALAEAQTLKERGLPHDHNAVVNGFKSVTFRGQYRSGDPEDRGSRICTSASAWGRIAKP